jgi:hypothetical protein
MTNKFKIDKWDVYVGIFLALLAIVWLHSECNRTTESTATTSTSTTSSPTRPDFISVSLENYPNWGNFKENTRLEGTLYQVWGVTLNIQDSLWVELEKSYPYLLLFLKGEKVVRILPIRSYREFSGDDIKRETDSTVTTSSGTYWKPRYCIKKGSKYAITDSYVVSVVPVEEEAKKPHTYWWWVALVIAFALVCGGVFLVICGFVDSEVAMIVTGVVVDIFSGYWISYLFGC